mgnify:CR=1 FL=1
MEKTSKGHILESYELDVDLARVKINIEKEESGCFYNLSIPKIDTGTAALLDEIRKELVSVTSIAIGEIVDQKSIAKVKQQFMKDAGKMLKEKVPDIEKDTEDFLVYCRAYRRLRDGQLRSS